VLLSAGSGCRLRRRTPSRWRRSAPSARAPGSVPRGPRSHPRGAACRGRTPRWAGHRVRYFSAAELVETLYRGLADNSVGKVIDTLLRNDFVIVDELGFAPLDATGAQLLFRFVAAAYERRALGIGSHWPFESWGRFLPEHTTAVSMLDRLLHHCHTVVTDGDSYRMKQARAKGGTRIKTS
jgi:DNA replication protein DnaC